MEIKRNGFTIAAKFHPNDMFGELEGKAYADLDKRFGFWDIGISYGGICLYHDVSMERETAEHVANFAYYIELIDEDPINAARYFSNQWAKAWEGMPHHHETVYDNLHSVCIMLGIYNAK